MAQIPVEIQRSLNGGFFGCGEFSPRDLSLPGCESSTPHHFAAEGSDWRVFQARLRAAARFALNAVASGEPVELVLTIRESKGGALLGGANWPSVLEWAFSVLSPSRYIPLFQPELEDGSLFRLYTPLGRLFFAVQDKGVTNPSPEFQFWMLGHLKEGVRAKSPSDSEEMIRHLLACADDSLPIGESR